MADVLKLFCLVEGHSTSRAFSVKFSSADTVDDLKNLIKAQQTSEFDGIDANALTLWLVSIPVLDDEDDGESAIMLHSLNEKKKLKPTTDLSEVFTEGAPKKTIHIIVQRPVPGPFAAPRPVSSFLRAASPTYKELDAIIKDVVKQFFAPESFAALFLDSYVQGQQGLPTTTDGICGLPRMWRRGRRRAPESHPSLLLLDLPLPPESADHLVPERFRSNAVLNLLEESLMRDIPIFGVSGCGKTRSVIEVLCLQWGFYFNASADDIGSDDLNIFAGIITEETSVELGTSANTVFARKMTLLLFLSRLLIFNYCLQVPGCRQTFTSASWAILQVCAPILQEPQDVFSVLSKELFDLLQVRSIDEEALETVVQREFQSVRDRLAAHGYPNFSTATMLRLVLDKAQILGDWGPTLFQSLFQGSEKRPMSPMLDGFRGVGNLYNFTIIYCGTGLSIRTPRSGMEAAGGDIKEIGSAMFTYVEFLGWTSRESIHSYIDRVKEQLSDDESKQAMDTLLQEQFLMSLVNYFQVKDRLFVAAAERAMLHSTDASVHGNMWETMMPAVFVETFKDRPLSSWRLLPNDSIPDLLAGQVTIVGYNEKDPKLGISYRSITTEEFMKAHVKHNSKQGDKAIPPFHFPDPQVSDPDYFPVFVQLKLRQVLPRSDAEQALATISGRTVEEKQKQEKQKQEKLEQEMSKREKLEQEKQKQEKKQQKRARQKKSRREKLRQEKLEQETEYQKPEKQKPPELQDYCPTKVYISMIITYPAVVVSFRGPIRPDPEPELAELHRVIIRVDDSNFAQIFPEYHVKFLDGLKHFKRNAEDQQGQGRHKRLWADCK
ncbi:hypothetical protein BGZ54_009275 [Gamsiella multidivaricata]|nr:hypothetical protein BGZ54_009275 [Gamsiella multidivaricata]